MSIELTYQGLRADRQREVIIHYRDLPLRPQRIDVIVENQVVLEIKAVEQLHSLHRSQLISYVRSSGGAETQARLLERLVFPPAPRPSLATAASRPRPGDSVATI